MRSSNPNLPTPQENNREASCTTQGPFQMSLKASVHMLALAIPWCPIFGHCPSQSPLLFGNFIHYFSSNHHPYSSNCQYLSLLHSTFLNR